MHIFTKVRLNDKITIKPYELTSSLDKFILRKLQYNLEGKCSHHGYIQPFSIKVISKTPGKAVAASLNGDTVFYVFFEAKLCNPAVGSTIQATIVNFNMFGILAEASININNNDIPVIEVIIAKKDETHDNVKIGDNIKIKILGKKFELNDNKIVVIGSIIKGDTTETENVVESQKDEDDEEDDEDKKADDDDDDEEDEQVKKLPIPITGGELDGSDVELDDDEDDDGGGSDGSAACSECDD